MMTWEEVKAYALQEYTDGRLLGKEYANFVLGALQTQMQIEADAAVKLSQKLLIDQQKLTEVQTTAKASYEALTLLPSQNSLITEQIATENSKQASMLADDGVKNSQKAMIDQQKLTEVQTTAKASYEALTLLPSQNSLIIEQVATENSKQASMLADDGVKNSQKAMIDQQKLTEVQSTAKAEYEVTNFLPIDMGIKQQQVKQLKVEVALKHTQKNQIEQSVYDNRFIKIQGDLADMTGMILNGGTQAVPAGLATSLTNAISTLVAIPKETVVIEE